MSICKNCIHYNVCEYSTIADKEVDCKDFLSKTLKSDTVRKMRDMLSDKALNKYPYVGYIDVFDVEKVARELLEENNG